MPGGINLGAIPYHIVDIEPPRSILRYVTDSFDEADTILLSTHTADVLAAGVGPSWVTADIGDDTLGVWSVDTVGRVRLDAAGDGNTRACYIQSFSPNGDIESGGTINAINQGWMIST